jgi:hypothetical protein
MARDVIMAGKETFSLPLPKYASMKAYGEVDVQGVYKLSEDFAKPYFYKY